MDIAAIPKCSEVETTLNRSTPGGATLKGPAKTFSPEERSSNRPSARQASGESVASVTKIPGEVPVRYEELDAGWGRTLGTAFLDLECHISPVPGWVEGKRARTQMQEEKRAFY